jgi:hypothetical protein
MVVVGTTANLAVPVTTAESLSVSKDEGPENADQNEEASLLVMWVAVALARWAANDASADEGEGDS